MGKGEACTGFWCGKLRENHCRDPDVDGIIVLRWIFRKCGKGLWTGLGWLRIWQVVDTYECGNELSGSIKYE
jgi:hypothetical protein